MNALFKLSQRDFIIPIIYVLLDNDNTSQKTKEQKKSKQNTTM